MTRYQLIKLVEWSDILRSRKRLQKVVFMLQVAGCPLDVDYILHHYGPYSEDLARLTDEMVQLDLLNETEQPNTVGVLYSYALTDSAKKHVEEFEKTDRGQQALQQLLSWEEKAKELVGVDLQTLEIASTIVYFQKQENNWERAVEKTCRFKQLNLESSKRLLESARELAQSFLP